MPDVDFGRFKSRAGINPGGELWGPTIASAATITLSHGFHKISGTAEITTINPPYTGFHGKVTIVPTGAFTFATGGNIATAFTATANRPFDLTSDGTTWFVQTVA